MGGAALVHVAAAYAVVYFSASLASAEIFHFNGTLVPEAETLQAVHAFYVTVRPTASGDTEDEASRRHVAVHLQGLRVQPLPGEPPLEGAIGVEVSILRYDRFVQLQPSRLCCLKEDAEKAWCFPKSLNLLSTIERQPFVAGQEHKADITNGISARSQLDHAELFTTGVYVLSVSNCGDNLRGQVVGSVSVRTADGYLPGKDYQRMRLFGWLLPCYVAMATLWAAVCAQPAGGGSLLGAQIGVTLLLAAGFAAVVLSYVYYVQWNLLGVESHILLTAATCASIGSSFLSYLLVLVTSIGWCVTVPYLDLRAMVKAVGLSVACVTLDSLRDVYLGYLRARPFAPVRSVMGLAPLLLPSSAVLVQAFAQLSQLTKTLQDRKQVDKALPLQCLQSVVGLGLIVVIIAMFDDVKVIADWEIIDRWRHRWLDISDISRCVELLYLVMLVYVWAPCSLTEAVDLKKAAPAEENDERFEQDDQLEKASETRGAAAGGRSAARARSAGAAALGASLAALLVVFLVLLAALGPSTMLQTSVEAVPVPTPKPTLKPVASRSSKAGGRLPSAGASVPAAAVVGVQAVFAALRQLELEKYAKQFEEQGWDDLNILESMNTEELRSVADDVKMSPEHMRKFVRHFAPE